MKAQKYLDGLVESQSKDESPSVFSIKEKKWEGKDKRRYYIRQLVSKGVKKC